MKAIKITFADSSTGAIYPDSHQLIKDVFFKGNEQEVEICVAVYVKLAAYDLGKEAIGGLDYKVIAQGRAYTHYFLDLAERGSTSADNLASQRAQDYLMTLTSPYDFLNDGVAI